MGAALFPAQLTGPSGASEWTVAEVLSHLGSGAEITLAALRAGAGRGGGAGPRLQPGGLGPVERPEPQEQAAGGSKSDAALVAALEAIPQGQARELTINPGSCPEPLPLASFAAIRLSESAPTSGTSAPAPTRPPPCRESSAVLAEHLTGGLGFLLGFIAKPAATGEPAVIEIDETPYRIVLDDRPSSPPMPPPRPPPSTGPLESALRLIFGRLGPRYTPAGVG